jgi:hypothetical protein
MKLVAAVTLAAAAAACPGAPKGPDLSDPNRRGAYVGMELGTDVDPSTTPPTVTAGVAMPDGVVRDREFTSGDVHVVVGKRAADAIVFLADDDGTVTDDFTLPGVFPGHGFTAACSRDGILVAMLTDAACANAGPGTPGAAKNAWTQKAGKLVEAPTAGLTCDCFTTQPE